MSSSAAALPGCGALSLFLNAARYAFPANTTFVKPVLMCHIAKEALHRMWGGRQ
jgi:hypothetical protein